MREKLAKVIERFPEREDLIRALARSSERFRSLIADHHDAHQRLNSSETEADPARQGELRRRMANLEEEMVRLMQGYPMA